MRTHTNTFRGTWVCRGPKYVFFWIQWADSGNTAQHLHFHLGNGEEIWTDIWESLFLYFQHWWISIWIFNRHLLSSESTVCFLLGKITIMSDQSSSDEETAPGCQEELHSLLGNLFRITGSAVQELHSAQRLWVLQSHLNLKSQTQVFTEMWKYLLSNNFLFADLIERFFFSSCC